MKGFLLIVTIVLVMVASVAMAQLSRGQVYGQANGAQQQALQNRIQAQQQYHKNMLQAQQELQRKMQDINFQRQQLGMNPSIPPQQKQQDFQQLNQQQMDAQQRFNQSTQQYNLELQQRLNPGYQPGLGGAVKRFFQ